MGKAVRLIVRGRVQRVGFRRYVLDLAQELNLTGYVKNLSDGSVEVFVQGPEDLIAKFIGGLRDPPPPIIVRELREEPAEPTPSLDEFKIVYGEFAEELQEGFGAMQSIFMEYWREFRDYRREFKDYRQEFKDYREEFRNYRDEFRDYRQEFRDYREEFRDFTRRTNEELKLLSEKYGEISERLTVILETLVKESKETREQFINALNRLTDAIETLKNAFEELKPRKNIES